MNDVITCLSLGTCGPVFISRRVAYRVDFKLSGINRWGRIHGNTTDPFHFTRMDLNRLAKPLTPTICLYQLRRAL